MKLLKLSIKNVRGLPRLILEPQGKNHVIWGPNGAGKSGVVDAVEFVLTGRIGRLTGQGTGSITLQEHGPHIDHDAKSATVEAVLRLEGFVDPVTISRCLATPGHLECPESARAAVESIGDLARSGQMILTRRELLAFITSAPSERSQQIESLLKLNEISITRRSLVRVQSNSDRDIQIAAAAVNKQKTEITTLLGLKQFVSGDIIDAANEQRALLGGSPITSLSGHDLTSGLATPHAATSTGLNPTIYVNACKSINRAIEETALRPVREADHRLRETLEDIKSQPDWEAEFSRLALVQEGLNLVSDATEQCPLCGLSWPPGHLKRHLELRENAAQKAKHQRTVMLGSAQAIAQSIDQVQSGLSRLLEPSGLKVLSSLSREIETLSAWSDGLSSLSDALKRPTETYPVADQDAEAVAHLLSPADVRSVLAKFENVVKRSAPKTTPQESARDTLIELRTQVRTLENRLTEERLSNRVHALAAQLLEAYESSRNSVLSELYDKISKNFQKMYEALHEHEKESFSADIRPDGAGLNMEVGFYGRGSVPPNALHSEGHQDSMGLCLFLTLNQELSSDQIHLIVLDDVMMSVDTSHRDDACKLLKEHFPDRQFLITTHDRIWVNQLRQNGVVDSKNITGFINWTLEDGPQVRELPADLWESIDQHLKQEDLISAASTLRNGCEAFFESAADALRAKVTISLTGQWELGDLQFGTMEAYKDSLILAIRAAQSWDDQELENELRELDSNRSRVYAQVYVEQWKTNTAIHYNNWQNLTSNEFAKVVVAFRDLQSLFVCPDCGGFLRLSMDRDSVKCPCGKVTWNLTRKQG